MARSGAVVVAIVVLAVASSLGQAANTPLSASDVAAGELCKLKGPRYSGRTSQGKPLCLTLWKSGSRLGEYAYGFRDTCGAGTSRTTSRTGTPVASDGSFSASFGDSFFKGRVSATTASGTFRSKRTEYGAIPSVTCDSGIVRWTARRKG